MLGRDGATLLRGDGTATYQLASVVDELLSLPHVPEAFVCPESAYSVNAKQ